MGIYSIDPRFLVLCLRGEGRIKSDSIAIRDALIKPWTSSQWHLKLSRNRTIATGSSPSTVSGRGRLSSQEQYSSSP